MFMDRFFVSKKLDQTDPAFDYSFILIGILGLEPHPFLPIIARILNASKNVAPNSAPNSIIVTHETLYLLKIPYILQTF